MGGWEDGKTGDLKDLRAKVGEIIKDKNFLDGMVNPWLCEYETAQAANTNSADYCIKKAKNCHIFILIFNGNAGNIEVAPSCLTLRSM